MGEMFSKPQARQAVKNVTFSHEPSCKVAWIKNGHKQQRSQKHKHEENDVQEHIQDGPGK